MVDPLMTQGASEGRRRAFLTRTVRLGMAGGLLAGYGGFAAIAGRYLYRGEPRATQRVFVAVVDEFPVGSARRFEAPAGDRIAIARHAGDGAATDFVALSSTCPHLGCQVHWEQDRHRFFCPCHNGAFDAKGVAVEGPPASDGQSLAAYLLHVEDGLLFIELPV
jgi:cytochrome b6-f complex iron-sulfur subunit